MKAEDLLARLQQKPPDEAEIAVVETEPAEPSETALKVDEWTRDMGSKIGAQYEWAYERTSEELADAFEACYSPRPKLAQRPTDRVRSRWYSELLNSPDYNSMRVATECDVLLSTMGTRIITDQYQQYLSELSDEEFKAIDNGDDLDVRTEIKLGQSTNDAIEAVDELVDQVSEVGASLGIGNGNGSLDPERVGEAFNRVSNSSLLRRICNLAGRYRRCAQSKQRRKVVHGMDDTVGVKMGGDVNLLVPAELMLLMDDDRQIDALRRIAERQAMERDHRGVERVGKGPIVVCVDESGSMDGENIENAKAFALSLAWTARHQNRWIAFVSFSSAGQILQSVMPPNEWNESQLMDWLEHFFRGGTDIDELLVSMPSLWTELGCPQGKTDIIFITDGALTAQDQIVEDFNNWRESAKAKSYGISLEHHHHNENGLESFCDRVWGIDKLGVEQDCVSELLSI